VPARLTCKTLPAGTLLVVLSGLAQAQTPPEPTAPAAAPAACPKGYEALCNALSAPRPGGTSGLGSQAGTGGKSTVIVHPDALQKGGDRGGSF
jgi:hypothetical protein